MNGIFLKLLKKTHAVLIIAHWVFTSIKVELRDWCWLSVIRYDSLYLACSKKLTCSQLSPPHWVEEVLMWEGFVENVGFERGVKEWRSDEWYGESDDEDKDGLTSERGGELKHDWHQSLSLWAG